MLKKRRTEMGLTQLRLARKTGVSLAVIQQLEAGKLQGRERELELLKTFLEAQGRSERNLKNWEKAASACADWQLPMPPTDFCQQVPCTLLQALAWCRLLKDGATLGEISPVELGFWAHGLVDERRLPIGIQPLPYLSWDSSNWRYVLWPQVRVCAGERAYQLDALVLTAGWSDSQWTALHMDGDENGWDEALRENLRLRLLSADTQEVHAPDWRARLEAGLLPSREIGLVGHTVRDLLGSPISTGELDRLAHLLAAS
ncbi:helix-turn-helix domain-containing protein [bacterium]|nr:helix-turn-helix domain-containing protein [bacterium]